MLKPDTTIYYSLDAAANVGIVVSAGVLMYAQHTSNDVELRFYAYDIMFDGRTYKNVPEEVLRGLKEDDEKDTE